MVYGHHGAIIHDVYNTAGFIFFIEFLDVLWLCFVLDSHEHGGKIEVEELPHPGNTLDSKSKLESAPTEEDRAELSRERSKRRKLTEEVDGPARTSSRSTMTKFKKGETDDAYFHKSEVTKDSMAPSGTVSSTTSKLKSGK